MQRSFNDEINLFELSKTLWDGRWSISAFVALAILLSGGYIFSKDNVYESKLFYKGGEIPPFYNFTKVSNDFHKKFYSEKVFNDWKKGNSKISLRYDDFNSIDMVNGYMLTKNENKQLATFEKTKHGNFIVLIKSNQLNILDSFFKYTNYINGLLTNEYNIRMKEEFAIIESSYKNLTIEDNNLVKTVLRFDNLVKTVFLYERYIINANNGTKALIIQPPTKPKKIFPKSYIILAISATLGGIIGVFFVLFRFSISKRK
ncbi:Wzz/FepE/Etk N-terminal domain-containing protein [Alphaproteobacteria bacterium]|nr:Wzz/FepE/Etk N-terminal domain-containing protein [Alphaproteobacteria bacterium]